MNNKIKSTIAICVLALFTMAIATAGEPTPHLISLQGYATDKAGNPITGDLRITIYNSTKDGIWGPYEFTGAIQDGIFDLLLGSTNSLSLDNTQIHYMDIEVKATGETNYEKPVNQQEFYPGGGEHRFAPIAHEHDASDITSGTLSTDRFSAYDDLGAENKIGSASDQVAAGDHTHSKDCRRITNIANTIDCATGEILTGGGCNCNTEYIEKSYPIDSDTWACTCSQDGIPSVYAICCNTTIQ